MPEGGGGHCRRAYDSAQVPRVLQALINEERLLRPSEEQTGHDALFVYDMDALRGGFQSLVEAFPPHFLHCYAVKAAPMAFVIKEAVAAGLGVEAASLLEVEGALAAGCPPERIVFDSPAKTHRELEFALAHGIHVNANTLEELDRVAALLSKSPTLSKTPSVGLRINPLVGAGTIAELSVSTLQSKFGVNLVEGHQQAVIERFRRYPWLCGLHIHVGSQGFDVSQTAKGVRVMLDLAAAVEQALQEPQPRITVLDIGGGLSANYASDEAKPSHAELCAALRQAAPELWSNPSLRVITEYGRSLTAKAGWAVSRVEYASDNQPTNPTSTTPSSSLPPSSSSTSLLLSSFLRTAILHVGADALLRECYCPAKFPHRVDVFDAEGREVTSHGSDGGKQTEEGGDDRERPLQPHQLAGPLCFAGDVCVRAAVSPCVCWTLGHLSIGVSPVMLPRIEVGDYVVIHDTGGYTLALFSRYCSRAAPAVVGYSFSPSPATTDAKPNSLPPAESGEDGSTDARLRIEVLQEQESAASVLGFWGDRG